MKPSDFTVKPWSSVFMKSEAESIARNIMIILKRTGDIWRELSWEEYSLERKKDAETDKGGGFNSWKEEPFFEQVQPYTVSEEQARLFSPTWKEI